MPLRHYSFSGSACPLGGAAMPANGIIGGKAGMGLGAKAGMGKGLGLGLGPCGAAGKAAVSAKGATTVAWTAGGAAGVAGAGQGLSLGLGLGLGPWGPVLLGLGILAVGSYVYVNRHQSGQKDELAAVLNGIDH